MKTYNSRTPTSVPYSVYIDVKGESMNIYFGLLLIFKVTRHFLFNGIYYQMSN